jgi:ABC-type transport system involved in multi-copper enzyme maturation permease subunit
MAQFAKAFFYAFASMQLSLVIVTVPAISAGAFSLDKARGTLTHMLVTQLSSHEIVVDTFLAR